MIVQPSPNVFGRRQTQSLGKIQQAGRPTSDDITIGIHNLIQRQGDTHEDDNRRSVCESITNAWH